MSAARDFWLSCGHHLLDRDAGGGLVVTDEFLKAYLARPEIVPPPEACAAERALHSTLLTYPRLAVGPDRIAAITDADARENWELMLAFRDHLLRHRTLEAAYLDIVRRNLRIPHVFLNHLVHVILRNVLHGCQDAFVLRSAEMFFRPQKLALHEGSLVAADEETLSGLGNKALSPLVSMLGLPAAAEIDVLNESNADAYWERSDLFDMALDVSASRRGLAALGEVVERWVVHLLAAEVKMEPLVELQDATFTWYVGLDAEATQIGDALWKGDEIDEGMRGRIVGLYRMTFVDPAFMLETVRGEKTYLMAAMNAENVLRLKPQNLVTGLPVRHPEAVS
jgi:Family of unknown function (DUF6352)